MIRIIEEPCAPPPPPTSHADADAAFAVAFAERVRGYLNGPPRLPQRVLGAWSDLGQTEISMIVTGKRPPSARQILRICRATGISLDDLLAPP